MNKRKICVVTGSRAEYGLLYWVMKEIQSDAKLELQLVATGMHLSPEFGLTYQAIEADGFVIDAKVETLLSSDTATGMAKSTGLGVIGFADTFDRLQPDLVVVLGDRFEILAASQAAFLMGISIAHISGGEVTTGAVDDVIRHSITKMARYHFVAAEAYKQRVIQLGEHPSHVFNVGDPGIDNIVRLNLLSAQKLSEEIGFNVEAPYFLVTYHPTTTGESDSENAFKSLLATLDDFPDYGVLITKANADRGGRRINELIEEYAASRVSRVTAMSSLGQLKYLSAMKHCAAVVGNSSSGIVEAPAMKVATVNIGSRQNGRLKASSIIDCDTDNQSILKAINQALAVDFQGKLQQTESLYGNCNASTLIVEKIKALGLSRNSSKIFYDIQH